MTFSLVRRAYVTARRRGCRLLLKGTACSVGLARKLVLEENTILPPCLPLLSPLSATRAYVHDGREPSGDNPDLRRGVHKRTHRTHRTKFVTRPVASGLTESVFADPVRSGMRIKDVLRVNWILKKSSALKPKDNGKTEYVTAATA